jgi:hypothetical protein
VQSARRPQAEDNNSNKKKDIKNKVTRDGQQAARKHAALVTTSRQHTRPEGDMCTQDRS